MNRFLKLGLAALTLAALAVSPVRADDDDADDDWDGPSIGGRAALYDPNRGDETWYGGIQLRTWGDVWGFEAAADYRETDLGPGARVQTYPVQASILARILPGKAFSPFVIGGAGWYFTRVEVDRPGGGEDTDTDGRLGGHLGAGLLLFLNEAWSVDATWRHLWLDDFETDDNNIDDSDLDDAGNVWTLGLNYHF